VKDVEAAETAGLEGPALKRLKLTDEKIQALMDGIRAIAAQDEPIGRILARTELSEDLILDKVGNINPCRSRYFIFSSFFSCSSFIEQTVIQ
jgi:gamma-glutamyl phosphate reductase